jgi:hypothetical protein
MWKALDIWPPLPIVIKDNRREDWDVDDIIPALEHNDRISQLELLGITSSGLEKVLAAMRQPFPALTCLFLRSLNEAAPVADSFLGGSAPSLQFLYLNSIPYPGLPKLLLSATHLVCLDLRKFPHSGYISPETMATCLSALTRLESFRIESSQSRPDQNGRGLLPPARTLLPVLTMMMFRGVSKYLEDLVARIDAPLLDNLEVVFFHQQIFDTPQLAQFISRTPKFKARDEARIVFTNWDVRISLPPEIDGALKFVIICGELDLQVSSLAQVCRSSFPQAFVPAVERLHIIEYQFDVWDGEMENNQWLELFHPFTAVKDLHMTCEITSFIAPALLELVGERVTEVLPALQALFLQEQLLPGPVQDAIGQFVATRLFSGHPIAISCQEREDSK